MKSKWLLVILSTWIFAMPALAQTTVSIAPDAPSKEDVRKLFDLMHSREQAHQMMQQLVTQMRTMNREQIKKEHPETSEQELARLDRQSEDLVKHYPLDEMLDDMIPVYQRHFTKADIDGLTAFYASPTGQKFLHEMPAVMAETMQAIYPLIQRQVSQSLKSSQEKGEATQK